MEAELGGVLSEAQSVERDLDQERAAVAATAVEAASRAAALEDDIRACEAATASARKQLGAVRSERDRVVATIPEAAAAAVAAEADVDAARRELSFAEAESAAQAAAARESAAFARPPATDVGSNQQALWSRDQREALEALQRSTEASERAADATERDADAAAAAAARWPTAEARQVELQRRMVALSEQLAARQVACAAAEAEVAALGHRLRAVQAEAADATAAAHAARRRRAGGGPAGGKGTDAVLWKRAGMGRPGQRDVWSSPGAVLVAFIAAVDASLGAVTGALRNSPGLRTSLVLYLAALHSFAFLVLAWRASTTDTGHASEDT